MDRNNVRALYRLLGDAPLTQEDTDLYVDLADVRGEDKIPEIMARRTAFAYKAPTHQLICGHRGSGKSTELSRLQEILENENKRFVVFCKRSIATM